MAKRLRYAEPPGRLPRGYFDSLLDPTKQLLAKGFRLAQAANWLIKEGALPHARRQQYLDAMRNRFSRFRQQTPVPAATYQWRAALGYDAAHAIATGTKALCSAMSARWFDAGDGQRKCPVCAGILRAGNVTVQGDN